LTRKFKFLLSGDVQLLYALSGGKCVAIVSSFLWEMCNHCQPSGERCVAMVSYLL
jgi:hypothetical protein